MDKSGWTTHCFGRFLVQLPSGANLSQTSKVWGEEIARFQGSAPAKIKARQSELEASIHKTEGSMLVRRIDLDRGSVVFLSWALPHSKIMLRQDTFLITSDQGGFVHSGDVSPGREEIAIRHGKSLSSNIRSRLPDEIPTDSGFCINEGFIAGSDYRSESFSVDVTLPNHPGAHLDFFAGTGAEENRLLDRVGGFLRTEVIGTAAGLKTLRKRVRDVGPIDAEEYLVAASDKGQRVYSFTWESQGKDRSLSEPNIGVNLGVLEQSVVSEKEPYRPAFKSDEEALELWDAIIASIRLRPGAV